MKAIRVAVPQLFPSDVANEIINKVQVVLFQLYSEYVILHNCSTSDERGECGLVSNHNEGDSSSRKQELSDMVMSGEAVEPLKPELHTYLDYGLYSAQESKFDALSWWKEKCMEFPTLSKLALHVFAILITTMASEVIGVELSIG
ncbi:Zinc finger BED domain-containing protein DAYSLEEPER [Bienertia sinuspersici]